MTLIIRLAVNALALWLAATLIDGIELAGDLWPVLIVAIVFGLVNAILGTILKLLTFPVIMLTLGLFALLINAVLLLVTDALTQNLTVDGFVAALLGSLVISVVSAVLNRILP